MHSLGGGPVQCSDVQMFRVGSCCSKRAMKASFNPVFGGLLCWARNRCGESAVTNDLRLRKLFRRKHCNKRVTSEETVAAKAYGSATFRPRHKFGSTLSALFQDTSAAIHERDRNILTFNDNAPRAIFLWKVIYKKRGNAYLTSYISCKL